MEKTSKIVTMAFTREWPGDNGVTYYHKITLENGDAGDIGCKTKEPDNIKPGKELTYTITEGKEYNGVKQYKIKAAQKGFGGGFKAAQKGNESFALSYAKDVYVSLQNTPKPIDTTAMFALADKMYEWLETKKK